MSWFTYDAKMELKELKAQPPKVVEVIKIVNVDVPVATQCEQPDDIIKPVLEISKLKPTDSENYRKIADAYVISLTQCMSYAEQQEAILDSYRQDIIEK